MRSREPDPADEFFDVVDSRGNALNFVKSRDRVHRDGDWHRSFHCWVVAHFDDNVPGVIFQRRSRWKDTHPGFLDVAVGGHYRSGEGYDEVVREIEEELGFQPDPMTLVPIGRRRAVGTGPTWIDREIQDVYVHSLSRPVGHLRPAYEEISALDVVTLPQLEALFVAGEQSISSERYEVTPENLLRNAHDAFLTVADFIEVDDDYWLEGARSAVRVWAGDRDVQLALW